MKKWEELPVGMQTAEVKKYYDKLSSRSGQLKLKRGLDVLIALILLLLLWPVLVVVSVIIKSDSEGPVMFRQVRITTYGRPFRIFKFRTMIDGADRKGSQVTTQVDPRITKVGGVLRKYRLDEIPQLFNVLLGDMSFVGTRPEVEKYVRHYTDDMKATLLLPAGITSQASIRYKDESQLLNQAEDVDRVYIEQILPAKMEYNLQSLSTYSIWSDIKTMFQTVIEIAKH